MFRVLPSHPNLDHLRKQAKDELAHMRRRDSTSKLADALHAVARSYGFATWPKLKAHVESVLGEESLATAVEVAGGAGPSNPFVGTWTADAAKSTRHPANQFRGSTLRFSVRGDSVTITDVLVDVSGREEYSENTIQADGQERLVDHGYVFMARWLGLHVLETIAKKDGAVVGRGIYEVSGDGRTLTVSARDAKANAHGWQSGVDQVVVLDRV